MASSNTDQVTSYLYSKRIIAPCIEPVTTVQSPILDKLAPYKSSVRIGSVFPLRKKIEEQVIKTEISEPVTQDNNEKHTLGMIIIKRKKMKKHKRKKFRRKFKFRLLKRKWARKDKTEKLFKEEIMTQLKEVSKFDPAEHVTKQLEMVHKEVPRLRWRGCRLPVDVVKDCLEKRKQKAKSLEDRKDRRREIFKERGTLSANWDNRGLSR